MWKELGGYKAQCLVIPFPTQGHINPMLQFSKRLQHKGIKVILAPTRYIYKTTVHSLTTDNSIIIDPISDGYDDFPGLSHVETIELYLSRYREVGSKTLAELIEKLASSGCPIDCLIYDSFLPWAFDVGKKFGLVGAVFFTMSCAVGNVFYHVFKGDLKLPLMGPKIVLPGLAQMECSDMPSFVSDYGSYPAFLQMVVNQFSNVEKVDWVLCNTIYELEQEEVDWMAKQCRQFKTIGPTIPSMYIDKRLPKDREYGLSMYKPETETCIKWLNDRPDGSVVYVSFGSLAELKSEQMEELAWALKKSNYYFLWVVRALEEAKLPKNFVELTSNKGLVVTWCPQLVVLSHKAIGCFVTHSGWNSTLEALSLGMPLVTMPQWTDQSTNAKYVMDVWEMGIRARPNEKGIVREEVVVDCITEIMEGERGDSIRRNAVKWRDLIRMAVDEGGSSDRNIDEFVAQLIYS
ncbi:hypothetical protein LguiA_011829 [Lonicera macranthoides]